MIELSKVNVKWPVMSSEKEENTLTDVSLKVQSGQLLIVSGKLGSGKVLISNVKFKDLAV